MKCQRFERLVSDFSAISLGDRARGRRKCDDQRDEDSDAARKLAVEIGLNLADTAAKPLDEIAVEVSVTGLAKGRGVTVRVIDADGKEYVAVKASLKDGKARVRFSAGGALGTQAIQVFLEKRCVAKKTFTLDASTAITTGNDDLSYLFEKESQVMKHPRVHDLDGKEVEYIGGSWLRDHVHILKASKYWAKNIRAMVDYYLKHQCKDGSFSDFFYQAADGSRSTLWRMDAEADLEYIMVEAVYTLWQVTGDDRWMISVIKKLEKGLNYIFTDPQRWSTEHGLIKRPFTIDTWDFEYVGEGSDKGRDGCPWNWKTREEIQRRVENGTVRRIDDKRYILRVIDGRTKFCIMHGDNSGLYKACKLLSGMNAYRKDKAKTRHWNKLANEIRTRTNKVCWNGRFYTHQVHLDPVKIPGENARQLSLSNTYDMNRGLPTHQQAVSIIKEYQKRKKSTASFAEWFSIDPPYPDGVFRDGANNEQGVYTEGAYGGANEYINGTVMPLVAGELAMACFGHGFENYGVDILQRFTELLRRHNGKEYFMYRRDGNPWFVNGKTDQGGPSPWGTAAVLYALMEGLAGIQDTSKLYQQVSIAPRWAATDEKDVCVTARYGPTAAYVTYRYKLDRKKSQIEIGLTGSGISAEFHLLLPAGKKARSVQVNGKKIVFRNTRLESSNYVDFGAPVTSVDVRIKW